MKIIILSGGTGTRLWPMSRELYGKQFLKLLNSEKSLFEECYERALSFVSPKDIIVVTNEDFVFYVRNSIHAAPYPSILAEPAGKNTLNALALALKYSEEKLGTSKNEIFVVFPSDHEITNDAEFENTIKKAMEYAKKNLMVTLGISPVYPETGYGYLHLGEKIENNAFYVDAFVEKPDQQRALEYLKEGKYLWNSGIFCFSQKSFFDALMEFQPQIYSVFNDNYLTILKNFFSLPSLSIDYGLLEKIKNIVVIKAIFKWNDFGSWQAIYNFLPKDESNNVTKGDVLCYDTKNSLVFSSSRLVVTFGIKDLVVAETEDAILIADKASSQKLKYITLDLKKKGRKETVEHKEVTTPWGSYTIIKENGLYKIKMLTMLPGEETSLQSHNYRNENWTVIAGTASIQINGVESILAIGQSIYVPKKVKHKINNTGKEMLVIIEVQSGTKLEEKDILRFEDKYNRNDKVASKETL
jgi:mannose-1-phosphate guanylyltransferase/mannose-6-phosphate isomerase